LLELVKIRASQINGCAFCVQFHILQADGLACPLTSSILSRSWRETPQFSARERAALVWTEPLTLLPKGRQRRSLCGGERGIFGEGAGLPELGRRGDQCLEPPRRRVSLDPAGAPGGARRGKLR
jgi:hypothetical protein